MARFNRLVLTLALGAVLGTIARPGVLEVAVVAAVVCVTATLSRRLGDRRSAGDLGVNA